MGVYYLSEHELRQRVQHKWRKLKSKVVARRLLLEERVQVTVLNTLHSHGCARCFFHLFEKSKAERVYCHSSQL